MIAVTIPDPFAYPLLFLASFGAATILPFSSEALLAAMLLSGEHDPAILWGAATAGNVGGACLNWWLGAFLLSFVGRQWFPFTREQIDRSAARFGRYGIWTLLLAWAPVIGDPLTFVAGMLRTPFPLFLALVSVGKGGRYAALVWAAT
ncbi:MAG: DedA family protein [Nitrospinae bacterium]|nr:DedA family protein [Nitrospinota bacterium]